MAFIFREDAELAHDSIDWMATLFSGPSMTELWSEVREDHDIEFVEFIETIVLPSL